MSEEPQTLAEITSEYGRLNEQIKKATPEKDKKKKEMFDRFDELVEPDEILVEVEAADEDEARAEAVKRHPAFTVIELRKVEDVWEVILAEVPELKAYTFINAEDGKVYGRQSKSGSPYLDDDKLRAKNPELWPRITRIPVRAELEALLDLADVGPIDDDWIDFAWRGPRELIPLAELDADDLAAVQEYLYPPEPTVAVSPVRDAKPEELEGTDE